MLILPTKCDICNEDLPQKPTPILGGVLYKGKAWCLKCYNSRHQTIELEKSEWEVLISYLETSLANDDYPKDMSQIYHKIKEQKIKNE